MLAPRPANPKPPAISVDSTYKPQHRGSALQRMYRLHSTLTVDEQLRDLVERARCPTASSEARRTALNRLLICVQKLPGVLKSTHPDYAIALNRTWEWFCGNLHKFEERPPSLAKSLEVWINGYLNFRIKDLYIQAHKKQKKEWSLDVPLPTGDGTTKTRLEQVVDPIPSLNDLDAYIELLQNQRRQRQAIWIAHYINQDPEGELVGCHLRKAPHCHCQLLAQRLLLKEPPDRLSVLARDLNLSYQTLNSHWKQKCLPLLRAIAQRYPELP